MRAAVGLAGLTQLGLAGQIVDSDPSWDRGVLESDGVPAEEVSLEAEPSSTVSEATPTANREPWRSLTLGLAGLVVVGALGGVATYAGWIPIEALLARLGFPTVFEVEVDISSDPAGLAIWIDGDSLDEVTPSRVALSGERNTTVQIELRQEGSVLAETTMTFGPDMDVEWIPEIVLPPTSYLVTSLPSGAQVFVDDQPLSEVTPVEIELHASDPLQLRVELDGFEPSGGTFSEADLSDEQRTNKEFHFPLDRVIVPARLTVDGGFDAQLSARPVGGGDPVRQRGRNIQLSLQPGTYDVTLTVPTVSHREQRRLTVEPGEARTLSLPRVVTIVVNSYPRRSTVRIDGFEASAVPFQPPITVGEHEFLFEWPSGEDLSFTQTIEQDDETVHGRQP